MKRLSVLLVALLFVCGCSSQYAVEPPLEGQPTQQQSTESLKTPPPEVKASQEAEAEAQKSESAETQDPTGYGPSTYQNEDGTESTNPQGTENVPADPGVDGMNYNSN